MKIKKKFKTNREKNFILKFKKMKGRDRDIKIKNEKSFILENYNPIYEQKLPHIKSIIFNPLENKQKLKRIYE